MPVVIMQIHKIGAMWFQQQLLQLHYWQSAICLMVVIMRFLFFCKVWILFFCIFLFQWTIRIIVWNIGKKKNMEKSKSENRVYVCAMYLVPIFTLKSSLLSIVLLYNYINVYTSFRLWFYICRLFNTKFFIFPTITHPPTVRFVTPTVMAMLHIFYIFG